MLPSVALPTSWQGVLELVTRVPLTLVAVISVALLAVVWQRYQRCPHCGRIVRRSWSLHWLRCTHCHRQYNRSVRRLYRL